MSKFFNSDLSSKFSNTDTLKVKLHHIYFFIIHYFTLIRHLGPWRRRRTKNLIHSFFFFFFLGGEELNPQLNTINLTIAQNDSIKLSYWTTVRTTLNSQFQNNEMTNGLTLINAGAAEEQSYIELHINNECKFQENLPLIP